MQEILRISVGPFHQLAVWHGHCGSKGSWKPAWSKRQNPRTMEWLRLERTSGHCLVQSPCSGRATCSQMPRTTSRWLSSISKARDSTASLSNLCQCWVTLTVKKVLPDVPTEVPVFQFVSIASGPVTEHHWKESGSFQSCLRGNQD